MAVFPEISSILSSGLVGMGSGAGRRCQRGGTARAVQWQHGGRRSHTTAWLSEAGSQPASGAAVFSLDESPLFREKYQKKRFDGSGGPRCADHLEGKVAHPGAGFVL